MNINEIPEGMVTSRMVKPASVGKDKRTPETPRGPIRDYVDTSELADMLSRSARDLTSMHKPRPEVVARFKEDVNNPDVFSDDVVDTILSRMVE